MEHGPFEDVFPIEHGEIPASYVSLPKGNTSCKEKTQTPSHHEHWDVPW